jgi:RluA family pseudouridine synthase
MPITDHPERTISKTIPSERSGLLLLDYLSRRFTYRSREEWRQELATGRLCLNGMTGEAETRLAEGDVLVYRLPFLPEPPIDCRYAVVYEDDDLLVVDKPAPLPCHPGGRYFRNSLWSLLREEHGLDRPSFINRLDRETSGLVLVAKNRESAHRCQAQFAGQTVNKIYLVAVEGDFPKGKMIAAGWLGPDSASTIRKKIRFFRSSCPPEGARDCRTCFQVLTRKNGMSLLEARPWTGRCHQIRATLCSSGFPVVGDKLYGVDERHFLRLMNDQLTADDRYRLRLDRQALHAAKLHIRHPATGRMLIFSAPPPMEFRLLFPEAIKAWLENDGDCSGSSSGEIFRGSEPAD